MYFFNPRFFGVPVPLDVARAWSRQGSTQVVGQAELAPAVVARLTWPDELRNAACMHFIDNDRARHAPLLCRRSFPSCDLSSTEHSIVLRVRIAVPTVFSDCQKFVFWGPLLFNHSLCFSFLIIPSGAVPGGRLPITLPFPLHLGHILACCMRPRIVFVT